MLINLQILRWGCLSRRRRLSVNTLEERCLLQELRSLERGFGFGMSDMLWFEER